jgi:hypothetical protein
LGAGAPGVHPRAAPGKRGGMTLQRIILTFKAEEIVMHALYRTQGTAGPNTKARRREVTDLAREGLRQALAALPPTGEGGA